MAQSGASERWSQNPPATSFNSVNSRNCKSKFRLLAARDLLCRAAVHHGGAGKTPFDIVFDDGLEFGRDVWAAECHGLFAVDEDGRGRGFSGPRQRYADVGMLALARTIHDAAHDGEVERLDPWIPRLPVRH